MTCWQKLFSVANNKNFLPKLISTAENAIVCKTNFYGSDNEKLENNLVRVCSIWEHKGGEIIALI